MPQLQSRVDELTKELIQMSQSCKTERYYRAVFLDSRGMPIPRVVEIGEELNDIGGFSLMLSTAKKIPKRDQCLLEAAWDNIGSWRR